MITKILSVMSCLLIQSQIYASQIYGKCLIFSENIKNNCNSQTYDNDPIFMENVDQYKDSIESFRANIKNNITLQKSILDNNRNVNTNTPSLNNSQNKCKEIINTTLLKNDQNKCNTQKEQIFRGNVNNNTSLLTEKVVNNVKENTNTILLNNSQDEQNVQNAHPEKNAQNEHPEKNDQNEQNETQYDEFDGDVIFNHGNKYNYPSCNFNDYKIKCTDKSCIRIGKWNTIEFINSNIEVDTSKIECSGPINVNLVNTRLVINNNNDKILKLLSAGENIIKLNNSTLIFNNTDYNNIISLFYSDDSCPIIHSINSTIELNNVILRLNNGYINIDDGSNLIINNSKIIFGEKGKININNSAGNFNNSLIELNNGKIRIDGNNSEFNLIDSHINSKKKQCILEISPCNKISLNNSLVNCLGKFKKIKTGNLSDAPLIDLKNKSIFSWRKMRCEYQDLNSIDETSAVILQEYYD